jgi:Holliday junction resolvase RusA-like endonuclease
VNGEPEKTEALSPPDYVVELDFAPVSFQGSQSARRRLEEAVREAATVPGRLLTGEVGVEIEWFLHEKRRWESPHTLGTPDLDNILKPLIDGLCAPSGLLIDDCQVQSVACNWIDWERDPEQRFTLRVRPNMIDDWLSHQPLVWIDMGDGLCWPVPSSLEATVQLIFVQHFEASLSLRDQFLAAGIPEADAKFHMPIQRRFHRARLQKHGFDVRPVADYKANLEGQR